jgi:hypothetical protein
VSLSIDAYCECGVRHRSVSSCPRRGGTQGAGHHLIFRHGASPKVRRLLFRIAGLSLLLHPYRHTTAYSPRGDCARAGVAIVALHTHGYLTGTGGATHGNRWDRAMAGTPCPPSTPKNLGEWRL